MKSQVLRCLVSKKKKEHLSKRQNMYCVIINEKKKSKQKL